MNTGYELMQAYIDNVNEDTERALTEFCDASNFEHVKASLKEYEDRLKNYEFHTLFSVERQNEQLNNTKNIVIPFLKKYIKTGLS